jgi:uncharacterized SAM-binding protein YcdF (DUF218 family)
MPSPPVRPRARLRLVRRWLLAIAILLLAILGVRWRSTLSGLGHLLIRSDALEPADLILVLGGDFWGPRVLKAAQLGTAGYAPVVLLSSPPYAGRPEGELTIPFLAERGYAPGLFQVFAHQAASTVAEAIALRGELARRKVKRVILVTSAYHSQRAYLVFRLFCPGIRLLSAPAPDEHYDPENWWQKSSSRDLFYSELTKMLGTVLVAYPRYVLG